MREERPRIFVIHENPEWVKPLHLALSSQEAPHEEWLVDDSSLDPNGTPPEGIFYSKMSASAHSRGHRTALGLTAALVEWLEAHGRRVINGGQTIQTEVSKARQYVLLNSAGIRTPQTIVANSKEQIIAAARQLGQEPFILKPNCGGKGQGVQLVPSLDSLPSEMETEDFGSADGLYIVQEYIQPVESRIVRMEFIGGKFHYAVSVDTSQGFKLCPADACEIPAASGGVNGSKRHKFEILPNFDIPEIAAIENLLRQQRIDIAGIEYVENLEGKRYFYDINTNTNYNQAAESRGRVKPGIEKVAEMLSSELRAHYPDVMSGIVS